MTDGDRTKTVFKRKLKGDPIAYDMVGKPIVKGDIIAYAASAARAEMRIGKIIEVVERKCGWSGETITKVKLYRIERRWQSGKGDDLKLRGPSFFQRLDNSILLEDPPQKFLDIYKEAGL